MKQQSTGIYNGWTITLRPNVHMWYHHLTAEKSGGTYTISCEDSVYGDGSIIVSTCDIDVNDATRESLNKALLSWLHSQSYRYWLHTSVDHCDTNIPENPCRNA